MIRITGGEWKGRKLRTPSGQATRPTPSRVREALFDILGPAVRECTFYDLFAGSGAVGIEALSRGAPHVVFVESARPALACLRENLRDLDCGPAADLLIHRLPQWLRSVDFRPEPPFILFLDPPYRQGIAEETMETLAALDLDTTGSQCIIQAEKRLAPADTYGPWALRKHYPHGDTTMWVYEGLV
jgi:16S rRNA (guanine966-N2)-methyltransferase